ncbi:MAG: hypothetical protein DWQ19_09425 [Crenarchaeota archaeon]|nr:MAG: hypothetical protein DWQ19_09425 [Thermoproteota archaeon]
MIDQKKSPFDELSYAVLPFLAERIATQMKEEIQKAYEKKLKERQKTLANDPAGIGVCVPTEELFK